MARSKNAGARRKMLAGLATIKNQVADLQKWWNVRTTVFTPSAERKPGESYYRERTEEEYPENQLNYWGDTIYNLDVLARNIEEIRAFAYTQYRSLEEKQ
jgi:hypothetical protein